MSSRKDSNNGALKNLILLRRASIDKIKCTAYPILGSIFEKKFPLIHTTNNNSMNLILRTNATLQFLYFIIATTLTLIRKRIAAVSFETLKKYLMKQNQVITQRQSSSSSEEKIYNHNDSMNIAKCSSSNKIRNEHGMVSHRKGEKKASEFMGILEQSAALNKISLVKSVDAKEIRLLKFSYGLCLLAAYIQLTILLFMIGFSAFKLGFLFLLACVVAIAYFVLKISFLEKKDVRIKNSMSRRPNRVLHIDMTKAITSCRHITYVFPQIRIKIGEKFFTSSIATSQKKKKD